MEQIDKPIAVLLLSGGMDSAVCAALAIESGYQIAALHLNYGQRTQQRELDCYDLLCRDFGITKKLSVDISYLTQIGGSSLTDFNMDVSESLIGSGEITNTYVPFRNANILAIATSWAEVIAAKAIYIGAMEQDSSGYPDCRQAFFSAFQSSINLGTKNGSEIEIITPVIDFDKSDIVKEGIRLGVNFGNTWSCYKQSDLACGHCESCQLRLRGFNKAEIEDPIKYSD